MNFASSESSNGFTVFGLFPSCLGSASVILSDKPFPLRTRTPLCPSDSLKITSTSSNFTSLLITSASLSVPLWILPALLSVMIRFSSAVEKLHLNAMSPGLTSTLIPAASKGPRPV